MLLWLIDGFELGVATDASFIIHPKYCIAINKALMKTLVSSSATKRLNYSNLSNKLSPTIIFLGKYAVFKDPSFIIFEKNR